MPRSVERPRNATSPSHPQQPPESGFGHLVEVLQRGILSNGELAAGAVDEPPSAPKSITELLDRAEHMARHSLLDEAIELCGDAELLAACEQDPGTLARREYILQLSYNYAGRLRESALSGFKAIEAFRACGDVAQLVRATTLQASTAARIGDGATAIELVETARTLVESPQCTPRARCVFWVNCSDVHETLSQHESALEAARKGLDLARAQNELELEWIARVNLSSSRLTHEQQRGAPAADVHAAAQAVRQLLDELVASTNDYLVPRLAYFCADALISGGHLDEAHEVVRLALLAAERINAQPEKGPLEVLSARLCRLRGELRAAGAHIAEAIELLTNEGRRDDLANAYLENCLLHEAQGKWRAALDSHRKYVEILLAQSRAEAEARLEASQFRQELVRSRVEAQALKAEKQALEGRLRDASDEASDMKRLAMEDPLTALANRRRFFEATAMLRSQDKRGLALLMVDVDHFKRINDSLSHAIGDAVLKELGALLRKHSRPKDVAARIGGEEFALLYGDGISPEQACLAAERLRLAVATHDWNHVSAALRVTISVGVTSFDWDETIEEVLARADKALYDSKSAGRDRVTFRDRRGVSRLP